MTPEECPSLFRNFLLFSVGRGETSEVMQSNEQREAGEQSSESEETERLSRTKSAEEVVFGFTERGMIGCRM